MRGEPFKRCTCRGPDGKELWKHCPRIQQRDHGGWFYRYSEPTGDGRRRQPTIGPFPTKKAAQDDRIRRLDQQRQGLSPATDRALTIGADFDRWLDSKFDIKPRTRQSHAEIGKLYIKPSLSHLRLADLGPHHLDDLYAAVRQIGRPTTTKPTGTLRRILDARADGPTSRRRISPARMRRIHAVIHAYLADRTRRQMIPRNPAAHIRLPSGRAPRALVWTDERIQRWERTSRRPSPVMVWTPEQTGVFLDYAADDRLYAMWHLIAYRGLRRGEACGLDRSELHLPAATVTIRTSRSDDTDPAGTGEEQTTKTGNDRTLALDRATVEVLAAHLRRQREHQQSWGDLYRDSGLVFTTEDGRPLDPDTVSQHFDRLVARYETIRRAPQRAQDEGRTPPTPETLAAIHRMPLAAVKLALAGPPLPPIRLHDLRHVAACLAYRATKDLKLVSHLMGHSGIQITADIYTSLFEEVDRDAAEAVAAIVPRGDHYHRAGSAGR